MTTFASPLHESLTRFILQELNSDLEITAVGPDDDLLEGSLVDSLGIMRLISFIDGEFGVTVPPEDMTIENFISVNAIVAYLQPRVDLHGTS